jgi:hypothetical protein
VNPAAHRPLARWNESRRAFPAVWTALTSTDWTRHALSLGNPEHLDLAARWVALGGVAVHASGNIYVFGARPDQALVRYVNQVKGRPADQTGTIVTIPERIPALFDWTQLPDGLRRDRVAALMDALLDLGPIGFRGPARVGLPHYLTADDDGVRTVQTVSPGRSSPTNRLYARILDYLPEPFLYGTSGNLSRQVTGAVEEPVHHRLAPLQAEFGHVPGFFMVRAPDEDAMQLAYAFHAPTSATVLSFHKLGPAGPVPALVVERNGSLDLDRLRQAAREVGLDLFLAPAARSRLSARDYTIESERAA